jgi:O-antigen ligase
MIENNNKSLILYIFLFIGTMFSSFYLSGFNLENISYYSIAIVFLIAILKNPSRGVAIIALAAVTPIFTKIGFVRVHIVDIIAISTLIPLLIIKNLKKEKFLAPSILIVNLLFLIVIIASLLNAIYFKAAIKEIIQFIFMAFAYPLLIFNSVGSIKEVNKMLDIMSSGTALLGLMVLIYSLANQAGGGLYFMGLHKNGLGSLMVLPLPYLFLKVIHSKNKRWLFFMILNVIGLIFSMSRGAWLGGFVGVIFVAILLNKKEAVGLILCIGLVFATFFTFFTSSDFKDASTKTNTLEIRMVEWRKATWAFLERPILGWGYASFSSGNIYEIDGENTVTTDPHNFIFRFSAELGLVGLSVFLSMILYIIYKAKKAINRELNEETKYTIMALLGCIVAYLTHGLLDVFWVGGRGTLFWIFVSLLFTIIEKPNFIKSQSNNNQLEIV